MGFYLILCLGLLLTYVSAEFHQRAADNHHQPGDNPKPPSTKPTHMHNLEYFLRGYNIIKGNPHQVSVSGVDPGFQESIFKFRYDRGSVTQDGRYFEPDGTLITICQSCSLSAVTKIISGMNSYRDSLSEKAKISGDINNWPWWNYRFSGSVDYKKVKSGIHEYSNLYTHSDASCCTYQIQTDTYTPPPFSEDFLLGVGTLPEVNDPTTYRKFIQSFGTHYIKQADMGSLFGQESKISKQKWKNMLDTNLDIEWSSSLSTIFAFGGYSNSLTIESDKYKHKASTFNNYTSSRSFYTKGSKPPAGSKIDNKNALKEWVEETKIYPVPISLELGSILDLLANLKVHQDIYDNMKETLRNYCGVQNCDQIQDGEWMPWLTTFGGQRSDAKACDNDDYVTWMRMARGGYPEPEPCWPGWDYGIYDLCFKCSTETTERCFNPTAPPTMDYWGREMICPIPNGFEKMRTFERWIPFCNDTIVNVQAQCNDDTLPQDAFELSWVSYPDPWVSCEDGKKIVGFQVNKNPEGRITNVRFECKLV